MILTMYVFQVFPVFYVLMSGKSATLYEQVFAYIEKIFELKPKRFMTDFESGLRAAIKKCYPHAALHGCWYHYCASLRRKLLDLHMHNLIANNPSARAIYRKMLSIPLLPPEYIEQGYFLIKEEARSNKLINKFSAFFKYFESFWLNLVCFNFEIFPFITKY